MESLRHLRLARRKFPTACCTCLGLLLSGDFASTQIRWQTDPNTNPVVDHGEQGAWDAGAVFRPVVLQQANVYHMWYSSLEGFNETGTIHLGYAISDDGLTWQKHQGNPVLSPDPLTWERDRSMMAAVVFDPRDSLFKMWYQGGVHMHREIGFADSEDGVDWDRALLEPVLSEEDDWEGDGVSSPSVVHVGDTYHMWYNAGAGIDNWQIGHAVSEDGIRWERSAANPVVGPRVYSPTVIFDEATSLFEMWYSVVASVCPEAQRTEVRYATSLDGDVWLTHPEPASILNESLQFERPSVVWSGERYEIWYGRFLRDCPDWVEINVGYAAAEWRIPKASFTVVVQGSSVRVDASRSKAPEDASLLYGWDFGNGTQLKTDVPEATHEYAAPGDFRITLTVYSAAGHAGSVARIVHIAERRRRFLPSDCNQDGVLNIADPVCLLGHLFQSDPHALPCGAEKSDVSNLLLFDSNGDSNNGGGVDLSDAVYVLNFLFSGGPAPVQGSECVTAATCPAVCPR